MADVDSKLNPISDAIEYDYCTIDGDYNPGIIARGGITGFGRPTTWESPTGKGKKGASPKLTKLPPTKGSIKFLLWEPNHFVLWDTSFRAKFKYDPTKKANKQAIAIFHPSLSKNGVTAVVCEDIGIETSEGNGLWSITVQLLEFFPEDPKSAAGGPTGAKTNTPGGGSNGSGDPVADAQQAEIKRLLAEANKP